MKSAIALLVDFLFLPLTIMSVLWLRIVGSIGMARRPFSRAVFTKLGIFPLRNHYYEPLFSESQLSNPLHTTRKLPGIDWNIKEQLSLIEKFSYEQEFSRFPQESTGKREFYVNNSSFGLFVAAYYYSIIRHYKPKRIIEVGSGMSTLLAMAAVKQNEVDNPDYRCKVTCVEPYCQPWLEELDVDVVRQRVENIDARLFTELKGNDILFIDSSHIIRPQGDVNFLYLETLPILKPGVLVHAHDIFSPRDYPDSWLKELMRFWNEQYLLEAYLSDNENYRPIGSLAYLQENYYEILKTAFPNLITKKSHLSSFWMIRN